MWTQPIETLSSDAGILLGAILGTLAIVAGTAISITAIVSDTWRKVRQTEDNNALKQSMLDRGMSADEIAKVIVASPGRRASFALRAGRAGIHCEA